MSSPSTSSSAPSTSPYHARYTSFPSASQIDRARGNSSSCCGGNNGSSNGVNTHSTSSISPTFSSTNARTRTLSRAADLSQMITQEKTVVTEAEATQARAASRSLCWTILTFIASLPAICGMCCWPSLVLGATSPLVTGGARELSHTLSFILTAVVLTGLLAYTAYCTRARSQLHTSCTQVYGPLILLSFASCLVIADPLRHVLQNTHVWDGPSSYAFKDGCGEGWKCLTPTGVLFLIVFTYVGFVMMFTASMWNGNVLAKIRMIRKQWREISAQRAAAKIAEKERLYEAKIKLEQERAAEWSPQAGSRLTPSSNSQQRVSFAALHTHLQPPQIFFSEEETNRVGYLSSLTPNSTKTNPKLLHQSPSHHEAYVTSPITLDIPPQRQQQVENNNGSANVSSTTTPNGSEYRLEGYSYGGEDAQTVSESVIRVSPNVKSRNHTVTIVVDDKMKHEKKKSETVPGASSPTVGPEPSRSSQQSIITDEPESPTSRSFMNLNHVRYSLPTPPLKTFEKKSIVDGEEKDGMQNLAALEEASQEV